MQEYKVVASGRASCANEFQAVNIVLESESVVALPQAAIVIGNHKVVIACSQSSCCG